MDWIFKKKAKEEIKEIYQDPSRLVRIEFANRGATVRNIWVEPSCESIDVEANTEYLVITHDNYFRIEFCEDGNIVFWFQYTFGFILCKRPVSERIPNPNEWQIEFDSSHIN